MPLRLAVRRELVAAPPEGATLILAKHASSWDIPLVADHARRRLGKRAYFQMGSFVGYRVLGPLVPILRALGGFSVMRPKEVRRLQQGGMERRAALERMREVNQAAEAGRRGLLERGEALVVFPEATRNDTEVLPLRSELELSSALEVVTAGTPVMVWPIMLAFGPRGGRRRVLLRELEPFHLGAGDTARAVLDRIEVAYRASWVPPEAV